MYNQRLYKFTALLKICGEFVQPSDKDGISHYFNKMAEIEKISPLCVKFMHTAAI